MNIEISKLFEELGQLHMQVVLLQEELAKLRATPVPPSPAPKE